MNASEPMTTTHIAVMERQEDYLFRSYNALETCIILSEEYVRGIKGKAAIERVRFAEIIRLLEDNRIHYAIIGGVAMSCHGEPRTTMDVDALVAATDVPRLHEALRPSYRAGTSFMRTYDYHGTRFDVLPANLRIQQRVTDHAIATSFESMTVKVSSIPDLLLLRFWSMPGRPTLGQEYYDKADITLLLDWYRVQLNAFAIAEICDQLRMLCYTRDEENKRKRAVEWLNETLEELGMGDRKYEWK